MCDDPNGPIPVGESLDELPDEYANVPVAKYDDGN